VRQGGRVHVYYEDIPSYTDQGRKEPPALLHAKMLLFSGADGTAELWVGSHNWTKRALLGLNVEASLVVRLKDSSPLFTAASNYLAHMKAIAEPFDLAKVDIYKAL
jgi:phosphatidylserine/phosphatidylglycerophosphate/cardiolipin synthase-like enzyme